MFLKLSVGLYYVHVYFVEAHIQLKSLSLILIISTLHLSFFQYIQALIRQEIIGHKDHVLEKLNEFLHAGQILKLNSFLNFKEVG